MWSFLLALSFTLDCGPPAEGNHIWLASASPLPPSGAQLRVLFCQQLVTQQVTGP